MPRRSYPYPSEPRSKLAHVPQAGVGEAHYAARCATGKRPPLGFGIILEVENGRIIGACRVEQSPVLRPEADLVLNAGETSRRGLVLVEAYGTGLAPAGNLRWAADMFVADPDTADFVIRAIEEKIQVDAALYVDCQLAEYN